MGTVMLTVKVMEIINMHLSTVFARPHYTRLSSTKFLTFTDKCMVIIT